MTKSKWDKRLLGTWKSDRRRTFRHWKPSPGCSQSSERKFKALFGKQTVTWKRGNVVTQSPEEPFDTRPYEIVSRDATSVVIRCPDCFFDLADAEESLLQIHFEDKHYWIASGSGFCEWFRKLE